VLPSDKRIFGGLNGLFDGHVIAVRNFGPNFAGGLKNEKILILQFIKLVLLQNKPTIHFK
jgi:hypothetical protein